MTSNKKLDEFDLRPIREAAINAAASKDVYLDATGSKKVSDLAAKLIRLLNYIEKNI